MPRLGELLVGSGELTTDKVDQALRAQVMWGGRLGTNLIELGFLDLDALSAALGRQFQLPAALARHFERSDRQLQAKLPADVAQQLSVVPLAQFGPKHYVAIACSARLSSRALTSIAEHLAVDPKLLVPSIAAELRMFYQLERVYGIPRAARFKRVRGLKDSSQFDTVPSVADSEPHPSTSQAELVVPPPAPQPRPPEPEPEPTELELELDDESLQIVFDEDDAVAPTESEQPVTSERRSYVRTIADPPAEGEPRQALGRIPIIRKVAAGVSGPNVSEAIRAIRRSTDRDRVGELVIDALNRFDRHCEAAVVLVVRGDVAISWKAFGRTGAEPREFAVPLDQPGAVPFAVQRNEVARVQGADLGVIDRRLVAAMGAEGDLVVVPIPIGDLVMCAIALITAAGAPTSTAETIAASAGLAFARLMRDAGR